MDDSVNTLNKRLDRFEGQLDGIRLAVVQMAKTEERVAIILEQTTTLFRQNSELQKRIAKLENENATQAKSISTFERLGWIAITAFIGSISWLQWKS